MTERGPAYGATEDMRVSVVDITPLMERDPASWNLLVDQNQANLSRYSTYMASLFGLPNNASDAVQNAWMGLFTRIDRLSPLQRDGWQTKYLRRSVKNYFLDVKKSSGSKLIDLTDEVPDRASTRDHSTEEIVIHRLNLERVFVAWSNHPSQREKDVLASLIVEGKNESEIAQELGIHHLAVRSRISRMRKSLRETCQ